LFNCDVISSLIKTKHLVVHVSSNGDSMANRADRKSQLYDLRRLRSSNIYFLRFSLGVHDWSSVLCCSDIQTVYDNFVSVVLSYINKCIPLIDWVAETLITLLC
jgi:hypothetical protein